jgi:hypothetical protein
MESLSIEPLTDYELALRAFSEASDAVLTAHGPNQQGAVQTALILVQGRADLSDAVKAHLKEIAEGF